MSAKKNNNVDSFNLDQALLTIETYLRKLQENISCTLAAEDNSGQFLQDVWHYPSGGGGITRVFTNGKVLEKAGVNFSHVQGKQLPLAATAKRPELANSPFHALGVSVVVHPSNPYCPTSHLNVRCIFVNTPHKLIWWFGGGFDLTPYYPKLEDCLHWHQMAQQACAPFGAEVYPKYKAWADDYFFLKHRNEPRGIGGIFFDDLNVWPFETCFAFMQSVGEHYVKAYQPILNKRKSQEFTQRQRDFQLYRRGRYVEFNLLYDRGTLFGLQSQGRTESILMSLPPLVAWEYNWQPERESAEEKLYQEFLINRDWC